MDTERVRLLLSDLERKLGPHGRVLDGELRARVVRAHADGGMAEEAVVCIVLAPPITAENLHALRGSCKERLGFDLPDDYVAFLRRHDGLSVGEVSPEQAVRMARDPRSFADHAIQSSVLLREWLGTVVAQITRPEGSVSAEGPSILPCYDRVETGCHAFEFSRTAGCAPRIVDVDGERLWQRSGHEVLAPSFTAWFEAFLKAGLEPFATKSLLSTASSRTSE